MGWNHPNPIYMYPKRKKRSQCNTCKYKIGDFCYQRKYQDYDYAELEGITNRKCGYFKEKQKNPNLRKKEIKQLCPISKELIKPKSQKPKEPLTKNEKKSLGIFVLLIFFIIYLFSKLWVLSILTIIGIVIIFFSIDVKKKIKN